MMSKKPACALSAGHLLALLAKKHSGDVFVSECKDGPSQTAAPHRRMDAWAMRRSWAQPRIWAYEIKVHRQDFLRDDKWHYYLEYCNEFYFVCPSGVITPEEVPHGAGLLWASSRGTRLLTKRKAPVRTGPIRESVFRYILMARCAIGRDTSEEDGRAYWRRWIETQRLDYEFGHRVKGAIAHRMLGEIAAVQQENNTLRGRIRSLKYLESRMRDLGLDPGEPIARWSAERKLRDLVESIPADVRDAVRQAAKAMPVIQDFIERAGKRADGQTGNHE